MAWALRRIDSRDVDGTVKAVQVRKVRQLYAMLDGAGCRAAAVRRYFGEEGVEACGQCDLCLDPPEAADATEAAQKALSAVHRLGGAVRPRPPRRPPARQDQGRPPARRSCRPSASARSSSAAGWRDLIDQLLFEGLLREDPNDGRPLIGLGEAEAVRAVYRGERRVAMRQLPSRRRPAGGALAQAPQRRTAGRGSRRCAAVRGAARLAPRARRRAARAALCDLPRHHAVGHRPPAAGEPRTRWRRSAASARASSSATAPMCWRWCAPPDLPGVAAIGPLPARAQSRQG